MNIVGWHVIHVNISFNLCTIKMTRSFVSARNVFFFFVGASQLFVGDFDCVCVQHIEIGGIQFSP